MLKLFKYHTSGYLIFALNGENPAKKINTEADFSCVVVPKDVIERKEAILSFSRLYKRETRIQLNQKVSRNSHRKKLTGDLVKNFDELTERGK